MEYNASQPSDVADPLNLNGEGPHPHEAPIEGQNLSVNPDTAVDIAPRGK